jgi:FecR protein
MTDDPRDWASRLGRIVRLAGERNQARGHELQRAGRNRLLETALSMPRPSARGWWRLRLALWTPLTAAAIALLLLLGWRARERPLTYTMRGGQQLSANYLLAPGAASAAMRFSDGSDIVASPGTRLRVDAIASRGARVFIEDGALTAHVTHREHSSWVFVAGPFDVHITGTAFRLAWDARKQEVDLTLHEGAVEVESPLGSSHVVVKAGQRFHASLVAGTMQLENAGAPEREHESETVTAAAPAPPPAAHPAARTSHLSGKQRSARARSKAWDGASANSESWSELVRRGAFEEVIDAATAAGIGPSLASCSAADARALADAARYTHRSMLAVRSLSSLRERFPGTSSSAAAAFLLGRTQESAGQLQDAKQSYVAYLSEAPDGEFAAEALAGKMRTLASLESRAAARPIAQEYLRRYPNGVHVQTARHLLDSN